MGQNMKVNIDLAKSRIVLPPSHTPVYGEDLRDELSLYQTGKDESSEVRGGGESVMVSDKGLRELRKSKD